MFHDTVQSKLKPILGAEGLRRLDKDLAIATAAGGGVVVHAPLRFKGVPTLNSLEREGPFVGVLINTNPLYDPVTLKALEPGAYVVGVRRIGHGQVAFDFYGKPGAPSFSTVAKETSPPDDGRFFFDIFDLDIDLGGKDSFFPPGTIQICVSFLHWKKCWVIDLPDIRIPWPF
jgi:hypothetical protein